jgi:hypothetical protein
MPRRIKTDARARMARTGERYVVARRAVIRECQEAETGTSSAETIDTVTVELAENVQEVRERLVYASGVAESGLRAVAQQIHEMAAAPLAQAIAQMNDVATAPLCARIGHNEP